MPASQCKTFCRFGALFCIEGKPLRGYGPDSAALGPLAGGAVVNAEYDVAVLGAGVVGASTAWHLAQRGARVVVIDATGPAAAASGASDGAVSVASKKPGVLARLATESLLYTRTLAQGGPLDGSFHPRSSWYFATSRPEIEALDALIAKLDLLDGPVRVGRDGARALLPGVGDCVQRLVEIRGEGHMTGFAATRAFLSDRRIARLWPAPVAEIEPRSSDVIVALADGRRLSAGTVVAALGVATPKFFPDLPVHPLAGQLIVTDRGPLGSLQGALTAASYLIAKTADPSRLPRPPVVIDPLMTGQMLIGSSRVDHGDPARTDFAMILRLLRSAAAAWPALAERRVIRAFVGVRAAVRDGLPIVGPLPGEPRILMATGFEGDGICLSALTGREVAAMAVGDSPALADIAALAPARFSLKHGLRR